jgi:hypothetical protein
VDHHIVAIESLFENSVSSLGKTRVSKTRKEWIMTKRIIAIAFIFVCASVAWAVLGGTIFSRTYDSGVATSSKVASTWGAQQNQGPPSASFTTKVSNKEEVLENGKKTVKTVETKFDTELPLESSNIDVDLNLDHRQKGLLWYSTYKVKFAAVYTFRNTSDKEQLVDFKLLFPTSQAIYDNLNFVVDGVPLSISNEKNSARSAAKVGAGKTAVLAVGYSSQGLTMVAPTSIEIADVGPTASWRDEPKSA